MGEKQRERCVEENKLKNENRTEMKIGYFKYVV